MSQPTFFQSLTRGVDIGANSYLLQLGASRVVLDAGVHPKIDGLKSAPDFDRLRYDSVDTILVSHAHLDHTGALPLLCRQQPNAQVFLTEETLELTDALLHNSVNVMKAQRDELGIGEYPLFSHRELDQLKPFWFAQKARRAFRIGATDEIECELFHAGHILGAAGIRLTVDDHTVFYTGDVHFEDQTLCRGARFPEGNIDTLIVEATRGDSERSPNYTRGNEIRRLAGRIIESVEAGGSVMIPVFAMGKTQELVVALDELKKAGELPPDLPFHIGGLSTRMTGIYDRFSDRSHRHHRGLRILEDLDHLFLPSRRQPVPDFSSRRVFALSSGMMSENTISNRFAHHILPDERNALLFVGYADPDSPAGRIQETERGDRVRLNGSRLPLNCEVDRFDFSGHAPRDQLLSFVEASGASHVILVHGDVEARRWMAERIGERHPGVRVTIPKPGEKIEL